MKTNNKNKNPVSVFLSSLFFLLSSSPLFCHGVDIIRPGDTVKDGEKLSSEDGVFELGFLSPENSSSRYIGIWYEVDVKAVVWLANRDKPISDRNGVLRIGFDGNLVVLDGNRSSVWSSNVSGLSSNNTAAILRKSGNLVLSNNEGGTIWESFNHPTDTFLPGMRVPVNSAIGEFRFFRSWKSVNDPSPGNYSVGIDPNGGPQVVMWDQRRRRWRSGQWNSVIFTGVVNMSNVASFLYGFKLSQADENKTQYFTYYPLNPSDLLRFRIGWDGIEQQLRWDDGEKKWTILLSQPDPANRCDLYNYCGNYATCDNFVSRSTCNCLQGFRPKFPDQWTRGNWSGGCERRVELQCQRTNGTAGGNGGGKPDGFKRLMCMKFPDLANLWLSARSLDALYRTKWTFTLLLPPPSFRISFSVGNMLLGGVSMAAMEIQEGSKRFVCSCINGMCKDKDAEVFDESKSKSKEFSADVSGTSDILTDGNQVNGPELPIFNFSIVAAAANNFCAENKLGQGGFDGHPDGELPGGQEIAVKRLSGQSGQGLEEFKNEIILIAKLQHRNLVRLLGCSIQGEEKMLIYEYMPNKSLNNFLFGMFPRYCTYSRLLYLHRDSRLRIIHRDLKASNILLDAEMNPKISDFGMARIFGGNQNEANTVRVVGTYGYMSPEYAMEGLFSAKSDVYSFGVLLLEIVSGRRNTSFRSSEHASLIAYAWQHWNEDKAMEIVDPSIRDSCSPSEVLKCIHIGMWRARLHDA
ncbi:B120-like protein [Hibiscus syriacus]|uniref:Receptor-like serine/threonine-protein kinase n=1 Tax=Hibiscus syriacus TaxID=106335 RepID=A0A6A2XHB0_HIBSY|nr:B120-like protein [Hibiscus syriacus]